MEKDIKRGEVVIYKTPRGPEIEVKLERETVWLTQKQMAMLFQKGIPAVNEHIKNVFKEKELEEKSVIRKFRITAADGKSYETNFYNLDVIISVGYRVKSQRGVQFRIWATKTLRSYLLEGYALNEKRLLEAKGRLEDLKETVVFLQKKSQVSLLGGRAPEILELLTAYIKTFSLLEQYDRKKIISPRGKKAEFILHYDRSTEIVAELKKELIRKGQKLNLFGIEPEKKLEKIIESLRQTFNGKELYESIEKKAAHLFYLVIKDHPFVDGNKRIASFLFVYFLGKNNYLYKGNGERKLNDNALIVLSLLVAESNPREKETMIKIIENLL